VDAMIQRAVERMYSESEENRFLEVTYANGDKEVLYFKDFNSGAMIENIVARAKQMAIKQFLETGQKGIRGRAPPRRLRGRVQARTRDLPNTTNPDDWARISGKEGRAHRLHQDPGLGQAGHRGRPEHRHRGQHGSVPLAPGDEAGPPRSLTFRSASRWPAVSPAGRPPGQSCGGLGLWAFGYR